MTPPKRLLSLSAALLLACSPPVNNPTDSGSGDAAQGDGQGGDSMTASGLPGSAFCNMLLGTAPPPMTTCTSGMPNCGVCNSQAAGRMQMPLTRTSCSALNNREFCDMAAMPGPPNLGCYLNYNPAMPPANPASRMVTIWGVVVAFGNGGDTNMIRVQVFNVNQDGTPGTMLGEATSDISVYSEMAVTRNPDGSIMQMRQLGGYKIPNIPTDRPLLFRTQGPTSTYGHAVYDYTLNVRGSDINATMPPGALAVTGDAVQVRPRTLSNSDWATIPSTAGLPQGIRPGTAAVAGEVHDCDDVRLANAMVYLNPVAGFEGTVYFSDNDTRPLPDQSRSSIGTSLLGLYSMLSVPPGPVRIAADGYDPMGRLVNVGTFNARAFADSVTVVTFRGLRPWQVTAP